MDLVLPRAEGFYCPTGDFYIDPRRPVARAVITHAHGDHARSGSGHYWCAAEGLTLAQARLGRGSAITPVAYGQALTMRGVQMSLHPAGHIRGSAQVRIEGGGQVWVVSGDYKRESDPTCTAFEPQACDVFVTETTFGLPIYQWPDPDSVAVEILQWWQGNAAQGRASVLFCYALGKAQRILALLSRLTRQMVYLHDAMSAPVKLYRAAGIEMLPTAVVSQMPRVTTFGDALILAPPGAGGTPWMRRFAPYATGFASGWMLDAEHCRLRGYDRGFALSDHADWNGLLRSVRETGARRVLATHGQADALLAQLRSENIEAHALAS
jgi:putative mRNA 3-end processing factor